LAELFGDQVIATAIGSGSTGFQRTSLAIGRLRRLMPRWYGTKQRDGTFLFSHNWYAFHSH